MIGVIATSAVGFVITVMDIMSMYENDKHQMNRIATHADLKKEDTQKLVRQASGSFNDKIRAGMTEVITIQSLSMFANLINNAVFYVDTKGDLEEINAE